jgi:hypothetical protein
MRTKAWGPPLWFALTCIAMGYPAKNPNEQQKRSYKKFFELLGFVMPCQLCRDSYIKFIRRIPLSSNVLRSRHNLVFWLFKIHNKVNQKLHCKVLNKEQLERKYKYFDTFRAKTCSKNYGGCIKPISGIREPKRTRVITFIDEEALRLQQKKKSSKK